MTKRRLFMGMTDTAVALVAVACLGLAGCGGGGSSGGGADTGGNSGGQQPPPSSPSIELDRTSIDFGAVVVGQTAQRKLTISNTGDVIVDVGVKSAAADAFSAAGDCDTLHPGDSCNLTIEFSPSEQKAYSLQLGLDSSADTPDVMLTGEGQGLNVEISSLSTQCSANTATARVTVSNANNAPVPDLEQSQFSLVVNGDPLDTFDFEGVNELDPVSVGIALDWSESVAESRDEIAQRTEFFLDRFRDTDTAGIFRFARHVDGNAQDFIATDAAGKQTLKDALYLDYDGFDHPTTLWDNANIVLAKTLEQTNAKRAVVLVTDGQDTGESQTAVSDLIETAVNNNVVFFTIGFGDIDAEPLAQLAEETGGVFYNAPSTMEFDAIYESIAAIVTNQYQITFTNPAPATSGELTVSVVDDHDNEGADTREIASCP